MRGFFTCFLLSAVAAFPADPPKGAQPAATPNMASIALMLQLLEGHKPFSAKAEMFLFKGRELVLQSEMPFGFYQGMARMELDVAKIKSAKLTPKGVAGMKQLGLDKSISWILPKTKSMRMAYPGLRGWYELPMPKNDAALLGANFKKTYRKEGEEKVYGYPCVREIVTLAPEDGKPVHIRVWRANILAGFPVKFELPEGDGIVRIQFANLRLVPPPLSDFTPPVGYQRHKSLRSLLDVARARLEPKKK